MHLDYTRLGKTFFAEVANLDVRQPLSDEAIEEVRELIGQEGVLKFHAPGLTDAEQVAFSRRFGDLENGSLLKNRSRRPGIDQWVADLTNIGPDGELLPEDNERLTFQRGNQMWHTDSSFKAVPARYSLLRADVVASEGGDTEWADLRAAWAALPKDKRDALEGLVTEHSLLYSRSLYGFADFTEEERREFPAALQPLVRIHADTGERNLFLGSHISHILGMDEAEGRALLDELTAFATGPDFTYRHKWSQGDLVMWDNRRTIHRGHPWPEQRVPRAMRRTTVAGAGPTVVGGKPVDEYAAGHAGQAA